MLRLVDHHGVVPQVYGALSTGSHLLPAQPLEKLRSRYQDNARKALWFTGELVRILTHLESAGIAALPYKGPVLAKMLYGEVTHRQFGDLDILILPADVLKARAALFDLGYQPSIALAPNIEKTYVETGYELSFHAPHASNLLELQWRITPRFYSIDFDMTGFFERAEEIRPGSNLHPGSIRTLCPQDLLLVLCVHAAKHVWAQLSWLCDIAQLMRCRQLDWDAIHHEARRLGIERIVNLNVLLAHHLLGSPLPQQIHERLKEDPSTRSLAHEILRIVERSAPYDTESISYFRLMLRLRERRRDQVRLLWRLTVTPSLSEWSTVCLPKPLHKLYGVVRLSRLAKRLASAG